MRSRKNGLILLYPLYGKNKSDNNIPDDEYQMYGMEKYPVFGAIISFSGKFEKGTEIEYVFDQKMVEQMELEFMN